MGKFNEKEFIEKFNKLNNGKYVYLGYERGLVKFLCKKHNEINYDTPSHLTSGRGCKLCGKENRVIKNTMTKDEFIERAKKVHGEKFDYSKTDLLNRDENGKVCIICPNHGEFWQNPMVHLRGEGCHKCGIESAHNKQRKTLDEFLEQARAIHGDKYDYSKVKYIDCQTHVTIICPIHGEFQQTPSHHLQGEGCPKCRYYKNSITQKFTTEKFIERAREVHGDKYDYSQTAYKSYDENVKIICPTHGVFEQTPDSHLQGNGCQMCANKLSKNEDELYKYIVGLLGEENVIRRARNVLPNHSEIDIFIPSMKIGIEYNGCRWHSELFGKDKFYHLNKTNEAKKVGISLIHIFEDEYNDKKEIVQKKIKHVLKLDNCNKINARSCKVCEITYDEAKKFLDKNHIQGGQRATIYLGAKYNEELVGVMNFIDWRKDGWELNRFASNNDYICRGIGSKMFSYFVKKYNPTLVKSFADRRWTIDKDNNLYTKLGFKLDEMLNPDYKYVMDGKYERIHKFNFRKEMLSKKYGFDMSMTETEMASKLNAHKIWDCGLYKYIWTNENKEKLLKEAIK